MKSGLCMCIKARKDEGEAGQPTDVLKIKNYYRKAEFGKDEVADGF